MKYNNKIKNEKKIIDKMKKETLENKTIKK
jgi:hypothetical protein